MLRVGERPRRSLGDEVEYNGKGGYHAAEWVLTLQEAECKVTKETQVYKSYRRPINKPRGSK